MPVLKAFRHPRGQLLVWCDHCGRYHRHRPPITREPRIAHCATDGPSPYVRTGYRLEDGGAASAEMIREADRQETRPEGHRRI